MQKEEGVSEMLRRSVLTIAGSDPSGGAGIQADLKTMTAMGVYGMSVITALTVQNTRGVYGIRNVEPSLVGEQLICVFEDIFPDAVKIGMVSREETLCEIAERLKEYDAKNIVLDPVMVSTSGKRLLEENAREKMKERLFPLANVLTPNIPEAEVLWGRRIDSDEKMEKAAREIGEYYETAVLVKGGHRTGEAGDVLYQAGRFVWFWGQRVDNPNTHGTGCTLSSGIACGLALGKSLEDSIRAAKEYLSGALASGLDLGKGNGPLDHMFRIGRDGCN